jgi:CheY-like chemotaxis protein
MAIVRHLVELHGGAVKAESPGENQGATFTIVLPVHAAAIGEAPPRPEERLPRAAPRLDGVSVLMVEDDADSRNFLRELLAKQGLTVLTAASADEALDIFGRFRPDVLISDIAMPGEDGYDLIRRVRALPEQLGGRTPAIALTAYVRLDDQREAIAAGYDRHVRKPVHVPDLLLAVSELAHQVPTQAE